jgi:hypothetical protein
MGETRVATETIVRGGYMLRRYFLWGVALQIGFGSSFSTFASDTVLEASALAAWEQIQKNDPKVVTFTKTGERTYAFSSKYFDYTGTIKVTAVDIEEGYGYDTAFPYRASIDVDLEKRLKNECEDFGRGFYRWQSLGSLHFYRDSNRWVTTVEYSKIIQKTMREQQQREEKKEKALGNRLRPFYSIAVLLLLIVLGFSFFNSLYHNVKLIGVYQKEIIVQLKLLNEKMKKEG